MDIYICFPGEFVLYTPEDPSAAGSGSLCRVDKIHRGKVQLHCLPFGEKILASPAEIVDSGEYGADDCDLTEEIDRAFAEFGGNEGAGGPAPRYAHAAAPAQESSLRSRALQLLCSGQFLQAHQCLLAETALPSPPAQHATALRLAALCGELGGASPASCLQQLRQSHQLNSADVAVHCAIARLLLAGAGELQGQAQAQGQTQVGQDAWHWLDAAARLDPHSALPQLAMAQALRQQGRLGDSASCLEAALSQCRQADEGHFAAQTMRTYIDAAVSLGAESVRVCLLRCQCLLRAINVARVKGAVSKARTSPTGAGAEAELTLLRDLASRAFSALGQVLEEGALCTPGSSPSIPHASLGALGAHFMATQLPRTDASCAAAAYARTAAALGLPLGVP
ncbi:hypothetical protein B484DRAFT_428869 [Ochromonadaceae sp. CCMP2298]|nr:hypothetical protein B484DRAFT_428869 [Ochromonadaceae sp. CCMP2298]|mmetsp:Transcript_23499/g.52178  ORF Transcript_23499/g.52178 Transcript_23499/m.52178 type:complete len:395 (+) Transcript_23499:125-1309(+)